jgi:formate--tetrahydrofolate ligase
VKLCEQPNHFKFLYQDSDSLWDKVQAIATKTYGAASITADAKVRAQIAQLQSDGYGDLPVCIAKTQYSFSTDAKLRGAPSGHVLTIREVRLSAGAGFVVMVCGDIMTMPGLPAVPAANGIDVNDAGQITGLS